MLSFISMEFKSWRSVFTDHPAMNTIRPAPARLVHPAAGERDTRREAVGDVRVPVQPHPAAAALLGEGARDAPVRGAADASAPAAFRVRGDVRELELDVYLVPAPEGLPLLVADVEPLLRLPAGDGVLRKLTHLLTAKIYSTC